MNRFGELQDSFQRAVLLGDDGVIDALAPGAHTTREVLLDVYKDAYILRLIEVTQQDYELLRAYVGEETFNKLCRDYIAAYPSNNPNARYFGNRLPEFLEHTEPYQSQKELLELARLEKVLNDAFDCVDAPTLAAEELGNVDPGDWVRLCFSAHPSVARLTFDTNATDIWKALKNEQDVPQPLILDAPQNVLVWRKDTTPMMRVMAEEEAMMWDEAIKRVNFGVLCEMLATYQDADTAPQRAAQYLSAWLSNEMITSFELADL